jgi:hypothetical protein
VLAFTDSEPSQWFLRAFRCARRRLLLAGSCLVVVTLLAACAPGPTVAPSVGASPSAAWPPLSVNNGTTIVVSLLINGVVVASVPPGVQLDPVGGPLPSRPWFVETRAPSGRVLSTLSISATDPIDRNDGKAIRVDLSCGRLDVWSGPPMLGPVFVPGPSGDCE